MRSAVLVPAFCIVRLGEQRLQQQNMAENDKADEAGNGKEDQVGQHASLLRYARERLRGRVGGSFDMPGQSA